MLKTLTMFGVQNTERLVKYKLEAGMHKAIGRRWRRHVKPQSPTGLLSVRVGTVFNTEKGEAIVMNSGLDRISVKIEPIFTLRDRHREK